MILSEVLVASSGSSGSGLIHGFLFLLVVAVCLLLIWYAGKWVLGALTAPAIALTIWTGRFGLIGLVIVINFLLSLGGWGFIRY